PKGTSGTIGVASQRREKRQEQSASSEEAVRRVLRDMWIVSLIDKQEGMRIMTKGAFRVSEFLIGIGIGLLTGLLWDARFGEETRKEARRSTGEGSDYRKLQW